MRRFKGGEPNRRPGSKARLHVKIDRDISEENTIILPPAALDTLAAEPGDLLYASHIRWWYGGLRSVHVKAGPPCECEDCGLVRISPEDAATAHFSDGQEVVVEKII